MKKEQAKEKYCPLLLIANREIHDNDGRNVGWMCKANDCMWWVEQGMVEKEKVGDCVLNHVAWIMSGSP
jgi:hypothetical protein